MHPPSRVLVLTESDRISCDLNGWGGSFPATFESHPFVDRDNIACQYVVDLGENGHAEVSRKAPHSWRDLKKPCIVAVEIDKASGPGTCAPMRFLSRELPPQNAQRVRLLFRFFHGLGDAVQFCHYLDFLRRQTDWAIHVQARPGQAALFSRQDDPPYDDLDYFTHVVDEPWSECDEVFEDHASTKLERAIRQVSVSVPSDLYDQITGPGTLFRAAYRRSDEAKRWLRTLGNGSPVIFTHGTGHSIPDKKNIPPLFMAGIVDELQRQGYTVHPLEQSMDDLPWLLELLEECAGLVGIDSGPEHLATWTETPTLIVYGQTHPLHYFPPLPNFLHCVRPDHYQHVRGRQPAKLDPESLLTTLGYRWCGGSKDRTCFNPAELARLWIRNFLETETRRDHESLSPAL